MIYSRSRQMIGKQVEYVLKYIDWLKYAFIESRE